MTVGRPLVLAYRREQVTGRHQMDRKVLQLAIDVAPVRFMFLALFLLMALLLAMWRSGFF